MPSRAIGHPADSPGTGAALAQMNVIHRVLKNLPHQMDTQARVTARHIVEAPVVRSPTLINT
jgi:hypothetical protein